MSTFEILAHAVGWPVLYFVGAGVYQRAVGWDFQKDGPIGLIWPLGLPWLFGEAAAKMITRKKDTLPEARVVKK